MKRIINRSEVPEGTKYIYVKRMRALHESSNYLDYVHNAGVNIIVARPLNKEELEIDDDLTSLLTELININKRRDVLIEKLIY